MEDVQRKALQAVSRHWAPTRDDVWRPPESHVAGLHESVMRLVLDGVAEAAGSASSPLGVVVLGQGGSGKTHLLSAVRERVQQDDGYFFLVSLYDAAGFWGSVVRSIVEGLACEPTVPGRDTQLRILLLHLADRVDAPGALRRAVTGDAELTRASLDAFLTLLRRADRQLALDCQDTVRALALYAADDFDMLNLGQDFLRSNEEVNPGDWSAWGIRRGRRSAEDLVSDISRLVAFTGRPTVIAVDQIDTLIKQSAMSTNELRASTNWVTLLVLEQVAGGLMALREMTQRTVTVLTCLPQTWLLIREKATNTVRDRFLEPVQLHRIPSVEIGRELIEKRFRARFEELGFSAPYPTWPVLPEAFRDATQFTPRDLLKAVTAHIKACLTADQVTELRSLIGAPAETRMETAADLDGFDPAELDRRFAELCEAADPGPALHRDTEDQVVPELLQAGLTAWRLENNDADLNAFQQDARPNARGKPALHARLRRILEDEDEIHWSFRAIADDHHGNSVLNRIRDAISAAGLTSEVPKRRLFLLRNARWNPGARKVQEQVEAFRSAGGRELVFTEADIRVLTALHELSRSERDGPDWRRWLALRRPAGQLTLLRAALEGATEGLDAGPATHQVELDVEDAESSDTGMAAVDEVWAALDEPTVITIGTVERTGLPVTVDLEALRRHTAIFAGSGSGKTVLIRRLVEECALKGVSAIVLDPNNDLARLGDGWPEEPTGWYPGDRERADRYLESTDVVVWTPRRGTGRPLSFQPLPDFGDLLGDPDEFGLGVDAAVAALLPRAKADARTRLAQLSQAVLRQALDRYARTGRSNLREFIGFLADLPEDVSDLDNGPKIAADLAQLLTATMVNDPLFGGGGAPADPALLLTPAAGKSARISVISFIGLPNDEQRQSFVNQLQLALFGWVKRNPAGERPLGALLVMDEAQTFAPSGVMTACTQSTLALASQARKYGLGLVFATQAPKGLHNRIPGNAATQLFGLLNAPAQIAVAREMARAKGSDIPNVSALGRGQFYATVEGSPFVRVDAPMCLSHHPSSALVAEEVLVRSRRPVG
jgi:hypothetical protein